jgi:Zn-dependent peptidase ImmA (M78 family)
MSQELDRAAQAAQRLLEQHQYQIPVDVHQVARDLGIKVIEQDLEDQVSGVLVIKGNSATIGVNKNHHINRQRFTIAHECGHHELHRTDDLVFIDATPVFFRDSTSTEGS